MEDKIVKVKGKEYKITFPNVGQYYDIEALKQSLGKGFYNMMLGNRSVAGQNALDMIVRNDRVNNEFYVAPVYNYSIHTGGKYGIYNINKNEMHGTGTPNDLNKYIEFETKKLDENC